MISILHSQEFGYDSMGKGENNLSLWYNVSRIYTPLSSTLPCESSNPGTLLHGGHWACILGALGLGWGRLVIWRIFFTKLQSYIPLTAPKRTKKKIGKISHFSMVRLSLLVRIRISGGGEMEANLLIILLRVVEKLLLVGIRGPPVRVVNGKGIYRVIIDFFWSQVWDPLRSSK